MKTRKSCFLFWTLIILMSLALICPANANGKERTIGLSIFYGTQISKDSPWHNSSRYDWNYTILYPSVSLGLSNRWEVSLEGIIGWYNFHGANDTFSLGICIMTAWDFIKFNKYSLFVEWGTGIGWWNKTPSTGLVDKGLLAYIQYGTGLKFPIKDNLFVKVAYRFNHASAFLKDHGANTHGILLGIRKTW